MAQFIREHLEGEARTHTPIRRLHDRYIHLKHRLASANIRLAAHVAKRFRHHAFVLCRFVARSRLRPDASH